MPGTLSTPAVTEPVKANGFYSFVVTIPDDDVFSWTPQGTYGHVFVGTTSLNGHGLAWYRSSATAKYTGATNFVCVSTELTGTTGVDGQCTLGVASGVLYLENRLGASNTFTITVMTANSLYE